MDEWLQGFNDAVTYCRTNYKPFKPMTMPDSFTHRGNDWAKGFGEGILTTQGKMIDEAYPVNIGFAVESPGNVKIYYPKGHKALNDI